MPISLAKKVDFSAAMMKTLPLAVSTTRRRVAIVDKPLFSSLIRQMLGKMYDVMCFDDTVCALKHMVTSHPDVVVIDAGVNGDGLQLAELMRMNPQLKHIPLILTCMKPTDALVSRVKNMSIGSMIAKPFRPSTLATQIEIELLKAETMNLSGDSDPHLSIGSGFEAFCNTPLNIDKFQTRQSEDDDDLFDLLGDDAECQTAVLRLANSSYSPAWRQIDSFKLAVSMMGIPEAKTAALCVQVFRALRTCAPRCHINLPSLWKHAIGSAYIARALAKKVVMDDQQCFMAAFLHDMGKVVLDNMFADYYAEVREIMRSQNVHSIDAEKQLLGLTHAQVGRHLAAAWGVDEAVAEAIAWHHEPSNAGKHIQLASLVYIANAICSQVEYGSSGEVVSHTSSDPMLGKILWKLGLNPQNFDSLVELGKSELMHANTFLDALLGK